MAVLVGVHRGPQMPGIGPCEAIHQGKQADNKAAAVP